MSFKAEIKASLGWNWSDGATDNARLDFARQLLDGNGDDEAEAVWHIEDQTLLDGASTTLDLTALTRNVLGDLHTVTLACGQGPVDRQPRRTATATCSSAARRPTNGRNPSPPMATGWPSRPTARG